MVVLTIYRYLVTFCKRCKKIIRIREERKERWMHKKRRRRRGFRDTTRTPLIK